MIPGEPILRALYARWLTLKAWPKPLRHKRVKLLVRHQNDRPYMGRCEEGVSEVERLLKILDGSISPPKSRSLWERSTRAAFGVLLWPIPESMIERTQRLIYGLLVYKRLLQLCERIGVAVSLSMTPIPKPLGASNNTVGLCTYNGSGIYLALSAWADWAVLAHEVGHYLFGFYIVARKPKDKKIAPVKSPEDHTEFEANAVARALVVKFAGSGAPCLLPRFDKEMPMAKRTRNKKLLDEFLKLMSIEKEFDKFLDLITDVLA